MVDCLHSLIEPACVESPMTEESSVDGIEVEGAGVWSTGAELAPSVWQECRALGPPPGEEREVGELAKGKGKATAVGVVDLNDDTDDYFAPSSLYFSPFGRPTAVPIAGGSAHASSSTYSSSYASSSSPQSPMSFSFSPSDHGMYYIRSDVDDSDIDLVTPATSFASYESKAMDVHERYRQATQDYPIADLATTALSREEATNTPVPREEDRIAPVPETSVSPLTPIHIEDNEHPATCTTTPDVNDSSTESSNASTSNNTAEPASIPSPYLYSHPASPHLLPVSRPSSRSSPRSRPRSLSSTSLAISVSSATTTSSRFSVTRIKSSIGKSRVGMAGKALLRKRTSRLVNEVMSDEVQESMDVLEAAAAAAASSSATAEASSSSSAPNKGKGKMRAYSSPLPYVLAPAPPLTPTLTIALSAPSTPTVELQEMELVQPDHFDELLPRELQLQVFKSLVLVCEAEHEKDIADGKWSVARASQERWVGRDRGVRELVKISRVSRAWQSLALDGQLWRTLDFSAFPTLPRPAFLRLVRSAGPFIQHINIRGLPRLHNALLQGLAVPQLPHTHLRSLKLQGCRSLTTGSLHQLIMCSPLLEAVDFRALLAVTNYTCTLLATHCPQLRIVNLGRCPHMSGAGIVTLATLASSFGSASSESPSLPSKLRELRVAGLRYANPGVLTAIARHMPKLEVLDLSGSLLLTDEGIEAFVECSAASTVRKVALTARQAGRDPADSTTYYRRVTKLRHLSLSSCPEITGRACSHLAHAVPRLEFLELADIGSAMTDEGLVRLLDTTPLIRRVDLDDAMDITDRVIAALTPALPDASARQRSKPLPPQPGEVLEQLIVSYATNLTNDAILGLIRACPRLRILELDNTRISDAVVREFVRTMRKRKASGAEVVAVDCRSVGKAVVNELAHSTRPRRGWKGWEARPMAYEDANPHDCVGSLTGQDECDETKVVLKSFWSWQSVDTMAVLRERRRRAVATRRYTEGDLRGEQTRSGRTVLDPDLVREEALGPENDGGAPASRARRPRWIVRWSTGQREASLLLPPEGATTARDDRSCVIM